MNKIIPIFKESMFESSNDLVVDLLEVGIDSILEEGFLKNLPIVGLLVGVKKTAQNLHDRNLLRQTLQFIKEFKNGSIDKGKLEHYKNTIYNNDKKAEQELGRVLLLLNNNIDLEKSKMLANLYRNYINQEIDWNEFCEFSEIIKMILISDINYLKQIYSGKIKDTIDLPLYPFDRLISLGLISTAPKGLYPIDPDGNYVRIEKFVTISEIGSKFYNAIIKS